MPPLPLLLLLLLMAPAAHSQTLIDAAGAAAIQGSLQGASAPGYTNLLRSVEGRIQGLGAGSGGDPFGMLSPAGYPVRRSGPAEQGADTVFVVNGQVIRLCPSGLPCIGQVRRAMGMP
ncbi:MAG: hypothetical protein WBN80_11605 [Prochlorococcaceae cyanobacterium]